ncbi:MAG: ABC transporter permease [bacterium]|nr:ABC transporter permease [bacterium]
MKALFKKELQFYLNNPIGYMVIILFAVFANFLFIKDLFVIGSASMRPFFDVLPWLFMIFIPAITMRMFAEERRTNTIEVLLSLPVSELKIVLSKFLVSLTVVGASLLLTVALPVSLYALTNQLGAKLYIPELLVAYLGALLVAASFISIGLYFSLRFENQVVSFLFSVLTLFILIMFATDFMGSIVSGQVQSLLVYFSPVTQMQSFIKGIIDLRSTLYFVNITALSLFLTITTLERRD